MVETLITIFVVCIVVIPPVAFVVALLDGFYVLITKRDGLLKTWFGYE